jgi:membrane fusion protein, heavy metal efflux system
VPASPAARYHGEVVRIREEIDPETRTGRAVVRVANQGRALKAGMFATVRLITAKVAPAAPVAAITVPSAAVLSDGDTRFVFIEVAPRTFEKRVVRLAEPLPGTAPSDRVVVASGLAPGERLVVQGAFVLRSEFAKAGLKDVD